MLDRRAPFAFAALAVAACSSGPSSTPTGTVASPSATSSSGAGASQGATANATPFGAPGSGSCVPSAPATFANAICVCDDLAMAGVLHTHAATGSSASVGVNGTASAATGTDIQGGYEPYLGLDVAGALNVRDTLLTTKNLSGAGVLNVGADLAVGGQLLYVGGLHVGGALRTTSPPIAIPGTFASTGPYVAPAGPPCGCDPSSLLPIASAVAAAATSNDDAAHGLSTDGADLLGAGQVTLTAGSYYFAHADRIGAGKIIIDGAVTLYFDGSLVDVGADQIQLRPGATLDLYVSGTMATAGAVLLGDPSNPGAFRLFVGGAGSMMVTAGVQGFAGLVYAPQADVAFAGVTAVEGSIFAKSLDWAGVLDVTYDGPAWGGGTTCPPGPKTPPSKSGSGSGSSSGWSSGGSSGSSSGSGGSSTDPGGSGSGGDVPR